MADNGLGKKNGEHTAKGIDRRKNLTTCKWGHPYQGENFFVNKRGERRCLICQAIRCAWVINERLEHRKRIWKEKSKAKHAPIKFVYVPKVIPQKTPEESQREEFMKLYGVKKKPVRTWHYTFEDDDITQVNEKS